MGKEKCTHSMLFDMLSVENIVLSFTIDSYFLCCSHPPTELIEFHFPERRKNTHIIFDQA